MQIRITSLSSPAARLLLYWCHCHLYFLLRITSEWQQFLQVHICSLSETILSLQMPPDCIMQFSLPLLLAFEMSMQRAVRKQASARRTAGSHFLKRCLEGKRRRLIGAQISGTGKGAGGGGGLGSEVNPLL